MWSTLSKSLWTEEIQSKTKEWTTQTAIYCDTLWLQSFSTCNSSLANAKFMSYCTAYISNLMAIKFQVQDQGACIWRGDLLEVFFALWFWGAYIRRGVYRRSGLFSEICSSYVKISNSLNTMATNVKSLARFMKSTLSWLKSVKRKAIG